MKYSSVINILNQNNVVDRCHTDHCLYCCQFSLGFSVAGGVRVGNALGAGSPEQAKLSAKISIACAGISGCNSRTVRVYYKLPGQTFVTSNNSSTILYNINWLHIWIIKIILLVVGHILDTDTPTFQDDNLSSTQGQMYGWLVLFWLPIEITRTQTKLRELFRTAGQTPQ